MQVECVDKVCDGKIYGAGILCYAISTPSNELFFLLGKERIILKEFNTPPTDVDVQQSEPKLKIAFSSNRWSDLGGGLQDDDSSIEYAAAREFFEESLGVVQLSPGIFNDSISSLENMLKKGEYTRKIILCVNFGASEDSVNQKERSKRHYIVFLKQIPWDPSIPVRFLFCLHQLLVIDTLCNEIKAAEQHLADQEEPYFRAGTLISYGDRKCPIVQVKNVLVMEKNWFVLLSVRDGQSHVDISKGPFEVNEKLVHYAKLVQLVNQQWHYYHFILTPDLKTHPSLLEHGDYLTVKQEYLEKKQLQFWSLNRLDEVLKHGGIYRKEYFRPGFLPIIVALQTEFKEMEHATKYSSSSINK